MVMEAFRIHYLLIEDRVTIYQYNGDFAILSTLGSTGYDYLIIGRFGMH